MIGGEGVRVVWWYGYHFAVHFRLAVARPVDGVGVEFRDGTDGGREPHIAIGFRTGPRFLCPEETCPVHDVRERVWRHLNFFQYKAFIHAGVPRVACPAHGVRAVPVPWARPGNGVRAPVRGDAAELAKSQPVADVAVQVGEHDTRLRRFIRHYVDEARLYEDYTGVEEIGTTRPAARGMAASPWPPIWRSAT